MSRNRKKAARRARRLAALGLAGCLVMGTGMQASAATMKDLFDEHFYADTYPDLKAAFGYNRQALWKHFITYGLKENRNMNNLIDIAKYREEYADLDAAFGNNWDAYVDHFLTYGAKEGRDSGTDFNALDYAERYADLKEAFGNNVLALYKHYKTAGVTEHREARSEKVVVAEQAAQAAASKPAQNTQHTQTEETLGGAVKFEPLRDENGNVYDLGGIEIKVYSWFDAVDPAGDYGAATKEWQQWVQETYNFKFTRDASGRWGTAADELAEYCEAGGDDNSYVFMMPNNSNVTALMDKGYLYDLASLGCMDFSKRQYAMNKTHESYTKGDSVYGFGTGFPEPRAGIFFNKKLLKELTGKDADYIYDLQKSGEWNWSALLELLEEVHKNGDTDGDGKIDVYGISGNPGNLVDDMVFSNGGRWFDMDADGKLVCTAADPRTVAGLEFAMKIMQQKDDEKGDEVNSNYYYWRGNKQGLYYEKDDDGNFILDENGNKIPEYETDDDGNLVLDDDGNPIQAGGSLENWNYFYEAFNNGEFVFLPDEAYLMVNADSPVIIDKDNLGFVMLPKGNSADGYVNVCSNNVYAIPACYDEDKAWKIAFALDQYFQAAAGYEGFNPDLETYVNSGCDTRAVNETIVRKTTEGVCVNLANRVAGVDILNDLQWLDGWIPVDDDEEEWRPLTAAELIAETIDKWNTAAENANK